MAQKKSGGTGSSVHSFVSRGTATAVMENGVGTWIEHGLPLIYESKAMRKTRRCQECQRFGKSCDDMAVASDFHDGANQLGFQRPRPVTARECD